MALSLVDVGTTANDGTGDPLRTAFQTVNTALTAVNNAIVVGTGVTTFKDDSGSVGVAVASNGDVTFTNAGGTAGVTFDASANGNAGGWGIGTATPLAALHVASGEIWVGADGVLDGKIVFRDSGSVTNEAEIYTNSVGDLTLKAFAGSASLRFLTGSTPAERVVISPSGLVGFGGITPTAVIDINSDIIRLRTAKTPATAGAAGSAGDICWDANYIYVCTATNTWKRVAIATW